MATHAELLSEGWGGVNIYTLNGSNFGADDAAFAGALTWFPGNPQPKPTLQEVEARRAELEAVIAAKVIDNKRHDELVNKAGNMLLAVKVMAVAINELQANIRGTALTAPLSAQTQNQIDTLLSKIAQIEAIT